MLILGKEKRKKKKTIRDTSKFFETYDLLSSARLPRRKDLRLRERLSEGIVDGKGECD